LSFPITDRFNRQLMIIRLLRTFDGNNGGE
jgi:hypothetical protein